MSEHINEAMNEIFHALKTARKKLGLSQHELGSRVGLPQSHISKIESGAVDIQLSSLVQLARALDLELMLVPRKAVPAVDSIARAASPAGASQGNPSHEHRPKPAYSLEDGDE